MPPSIILEVLKITEAEMELRDATREAEQAREARTAEQITSAAGPLAEEQEDLVFRTDNVIQDIRVNGANHDENAGRDAIFNENFKVVRWVDEHEETTLIAKPMREATLSQFFSGEWDGCVTCGRSPELILEHFTTRI